jgi:hypothetical protein
MLTTTWQSLDSNLKLKNEINQITSEHQQYSKMQFFAFFAIVFSVWLVFVVFMVALMTYCDNQYALDEDIVVVLEKQGYREASSTAGDFV